MVSKRTKHAGEGRRLKAGGRTPARTGVSLMTAKGQVTISADLRKALGLHPGDRVRMTLSESGSLRIERIRRWEEIAQDLPLATVPPIDWVALREEHGEDVARKVAGQLAAEEERRSRAVS